LKVTFIKLFNKNKQEKEDGMMKFLREEEKEKRKAKHAKTKSEPEIKTWTKEIFRKKIIKKNQIVLTATALMLVTAGYLNYTNNVKMATIGDAKLVSANVVEENKVEENNVGETKTYETGALVENEDEQNKADETETYETGALVENDEPIENTTENEEKEIATSTGTTKDDDYYTKTKLERGTMYSQMLESYQKILESNSIPSDQKAIASNEIKNINDKKNAIATIENLIKIKGFDNVVVLANDTSINVVVKKDENLTSEEVAQISNIVSRELNVEIEDIHITTHE